MSNIATNSRVDLFFQLKWSGGQATHTDCYHARHVNMWRDILPAALRANLTGRRSGDSFALPFAAGEIIPVFDEQKLMGIKQRQFNAGRSGDSKTRPQVGRFYPRGLLEDVAGVFKGNMVPFRCVALEDDRMTVDFNHPLAGRHLMLSTIVGEITPKSHERGGTSIDWMENLTAGPGMQARWRNRKPDFLSNGSFERADGSPDTGFYRKPRLTAHLDDTARTMVENTYGRFLKDGHKVLDLMSSRLSHVPENLQLERLVGLGLNATELARNRQLTEQVVHDLNADPRLPFAGGTFDVVLCTVSIEYLIHPLAIVREAARVLKPSGCLVVTFSNRWFPPKAIRLWTELHEFERMGLVLEYFRQTNAFKDLHTYSMRGLPRPHDDKYFPEKRYSDPVYAVWGRKK